jgi:hypothetical protein
MRFVLSTAWLVAVRAPAQNEASPEIHRDLSPPLSTIHPEAMHSAEIAAPVDSPDLVRYRQAPLQVLLNFEGIDASSAQPFLYPDVNGAVGETQYVQRANPFIAVFDKSTGQLTYGPVVESVFWKEHGSGGVGDCQTSTQGDSIVQYDKLANRWVLLNHAGPTGGPYTMCIAVSQTPDATGQYYQYTIPNIVKFPDYPKLGVWPDAYYLTYDDLDQNNQFAFLEATACALDRTNMLTGNLMRPPICFPTSGPTYHSLLPADLDGTNPPPAGSVNYMLDLDGNALNLWTFHVDFNVPSNSTFSGPFPIQVAPFAPACSVGLYCISQPNTKQRLDPTFDRLMYRLAYRNYGGHESLVVNHTVGWGGATAIRWYELRPSQGTLDVFQWGTYPPDIADEYTRARDTESFAGVSRFPQNRWEGSMAMDRAGNMALGYSVSGTTVFPAIRITGRLATDSAGTMDEEVSVQQGHGSNLPPNDPKWGYYTSMSVDPFDDCTFWYTNQYLSASGQGNWRTRIVSFRFSSCP